jgi:general secretion pathway protein C
MQRIFWTRSVTFVLWLLAGGCAVYWGLKFTPSPPAPQSATAAFPAAASATVDSQALAKGLGGGDAIAINSLASDSANVPASSINSSRFVLTGVVVGRAGVTRSSLALIGVDGKPARPYRIGSSLTDGVVLHSVTAGKAMLATNLQEAPSATLELPVLTSAVVGTAVAARPALPMPAPVIAPTPAANPISALGSRPPRPAANRPREAGKEDRVGGQEFPAPAVQN